MTRRAWTDPDRDTPLKRLARSIEAKEAALGVLTGTKNRPARLIIEAELRKLRIELRTRQIQERLA